MSISLNTIDCSRNRLAAIIQFCLLCLGMTITTVSGGAESVDCEPGSCIEVGKWQFSVSIGLGLRTNPLNDGDNIPLVLLPQLSYYGERFFVENLDAGFSLVENSKTLFNLIATPSYDGVFFNRWDPGNLFVDIGSVADAGAGTAEDSAPDDNITEINANELSTRQFSYLGGLEFSYETKFGTLQSSILTDISRRHSGSEIRFAYQHTVNRHFSTTVGFTWKDKKLTDYYYGIDADEVVDDRGRYEPGPSVNPFVRLSTTSDQEIAGWRLSFEVQKLDRQITRSPIVDEDYVVTFFVGKHIDFK